MMRLFALIILMYSLHASSSSTQSGWATRITRVAAGDVVVYFQFDSARLTQYSREIVRQAAKKATTMGASLVAVEGHADAAGSPEYNLRISRLRAEAVAKELLLNGVAAANIRVDWKGEFEPAVPGSPDAPNPLNRQVKIGISP